MSWGEEREKERERKGVVAETESQRARITSNLTGHFGVPDIYIELLLLLLLLYIMLRVRITHTYILYI